MENCVLLFHINDAMETMAFFVSDYLPVSFLFVWFVTVCVFLSVRLPVFLSLSASLSLSVSDRPLIRLLVCLSPSLVLY